MNKAQILFVGDFDQSFIKQISNDNWEVKHKSNSKEAITLLGKERIDLIISRDRIDKLNGYQLCLFIKSNPFTSNLPFIIVGEKKIKENAFQASWFAKPDRVAEFTEVLKKPQSLAKLIAEDLKQNISSRPKQIELLPATSSLRMETDWYDSLNTELLLERSVAMRMLALLHRPKIKTYLNECFAAINDILRADLCGMGVSGLHKPWLAFSGIKGLNKNSFDNLLKTVNDSLVVSGEMSIVSTPAITEKGGSIISDFISVPVVGEGSAPGVLIFAKYDNEKFTAMDRAIISYIERYAKPVFEFLLAEQETESLRSREAVRAAIDPLTGLYNLEFLIGFLQQQLLFSFRNKLPVSLLMIDIDRFSQINEVLGQAIADTILVKVAERLLSIIRGSDLIARYSSDKFVIVLPNTPLKGARVLGEKVRLEIEQANFFSASQQGPSVTVSVGIAEYDPHDLNPEAILKEAKTALQKAKESGRNKVAM